MSNQPNKNLKCHPPTWIFILVGFLVVKLFFTLLNLKRKKF